MTIFIDVKERIIDGQYLQALKDDGITVEEGVIEKAKKGEREAIHTIGCMYAAIKNKQKTLRWLGTSSAMGFSESQMELVFFYKRFGNTTDNYDKAKEWFKTTANNNIISAYIHAADICWVQKEFNVAVELLKKSAALGDACGQNHLGELYLVNQHNHGHPVVVRNYAFAMEMFLKAADQGYSKAQYNIGKLYENGRGVEINKYEALKWFMKSKSGGCELATKCIDNLNEQGYFHIPMKDWPVKEDDTDRIYRTFPLVFEVRHRNNLGNLN